MAYCLLDKARYVLQTLEVEVYLPADSENRIQNSEFRLAFGMAGK